MKKKPAKKGASGQPSEWVSEWRIEAARQGFCRVKVTDRIEGWTVETGQPMEIAG